jgi:uncharacterized alkaline shock family protein YloU
LKEQEIDTIQPGEYASDRGKTTVSPEVMLTIARMTTLNVPGVSALSNIPGGVNRLFQRGYGEGVRIDVREDVVYIDLYLILKTRAISEMVGLRVGRVNIHIEDIDYSSETDPISPKGA